MTEPTELPAPPPGADVANLLMRYIAHVRDSEGVEYIVDGTHYNDAAFTPAEWDYLRRMSEAATAYRDCA